MITVQVRAIGHGTGWNNYPVDFTFSMSEGYDHEEIIARARRMARDKTACNALTLKHVSIMGQEVIYES